MASSGLAETHTGTLSRSGLRNGSIVEQNLVSTVAETIRRRRLADRGDPVLLAVSGGADSVCMLYALLQLRDRLAITLSVAHLDHGIRPDSAADARFVLDLCSAIGVPCYQERADAVGRSSQTGMSLETAARDLRYDFLVRVAKEHEINVIATAHTRDDQAETILFRLVRGSGPRGLSGIPYQREHNGIRIIRPLLDCPRQQVVDFLNEIDRPWREDSSNSDVRFTRNRIRNQVLPYLEANLNPSVREALVRTAEILSEEERWLESLTRDALGRCADPQGGGGLDVEALKALDLALLRRVIRHWLRAAGIPMGDVDFDTLESATALLVRGAGTSPVCDGWVVRRSAATLELAKAEEVVAPTPFRVRLNVPGRTVIKSVGIAVDVSDDTGFERSESAGIGEYPVTGWIDRSAVGCDEVFLRNWRPGDRTEPVGMSGSVKLQDLFVDRKIPREKRGVVPLVECRDQIAWVPGYRVDRRWSVRGPDSPSLKFLVAMA